MHVYMATMASTSHGLSVFANTCVKCPVNSKTGLSASLHDKDTLTVKYVDAFNERQDNAVVFTTPGANIADMEQESKCATSVNDNSRQSREDEFYEKLQQLKEENKKTLKAYEKLYLDKTVLGCVRANKSYDFERDKSGIDFKVATDPVTLIVKGEGKRALNKHEETILSKPPHGKPRESLLFTPIQSETIPKKSNHTSISERPSSAPMERKSHSLDNEYSHKAFPGSEESSDNFIIPQEDNSSKYEKALAKVDKLWEDFKISEYTQRRHSFSSSRQKNKGQSADSKTKTSEWKHRITIPQPFKMSIREALKEKKKTSAQEELEQRYLAKQKQEEAECEKKFKAQPVPAHVYLPMYEEIMERNEARRKYVKQFCQELLQSQVKPFNFDSREKEKRLQRAHSAPIRRPENTSSSFKARPAPRHIFSQDIDDKLLEDEELRKIRVKMRSKELMRESSLPPNMAAREKLKEQERKEKRKLAKLASKKQYPRSAHNIPDYDALYNEFKRELERRRSMHTGTVIEPFNLETERIHSNKDKIIKDIEDDNKRLKENRWPFQNSRVTPRSSMKLLGALSNSMDYIPTQSTRSAELKSRMIKNERDRLTNHQKQEEEAEKRRKTREAKLRRYLFEKTNDADIPKPRDSVGERLKRMRKDDRERQEAYEKEIEDMHARVEQSPLLVEKYMAESAKKAAEMKFKAVLHNSGLDEKEFISTKSSRPATSVRSGVTNDKNTTDHHRDDDDDKSHSPSSDRNITYTASDD